MGNTPSRQPRRSSPRQALAGGQWKEPIYTLSLLFPEVELRNG